MGANVLLAANVLGGAISIFITDRLFSSIDEEGDGQPRGKVPRHIEKGPETQLKNSKFQNLGKLKAIPLVLYCRSFGAGVNKLLPSSSTND